LFDDYPYSHGDMKEVQERIDKESLSEFVTLHKGDAYEVWKEHEDKSRSIRHAGVSPRCDLCGSAG